MAAGRSLRYVQTVCLGTLTAIALGATLYFLKPVLIPFVLALIVTYCLTPVVDLCMRVLHIPRIVAFAVALLLGVAALAILGLIVAGAVGQMVENADTYEKHFEAQLQRVLAWFPKAGAEGTGADPWIDRATLLKLIQPKEMDFGKLLGGAASSIMSVISNGLLVLIFLSFMLLGKTRATDGDGLLGEIENSLKRYIVLKTVISVATGAAQGAILWYCGVPFPLLFGVLGGLMNFIPNIGPIIAVLLPLPLMLTPEMSWAGLVVALLGTGTVHMVSGNVLEPKIMGESLDLHPVVILLMLIFFGMIWGIMGMFLATPIAAMIKILLEKIEFTRPVAHILAGRVEHLEPDHPGPVFR